ncbi:ChaN family lipoprotein [Faecalibacter sp. LW9]|uniref:ChaN family lipoprotein n=1 Tax=Faecalibacter sp. LW9 TaxID=3103144 RepID=UPI002AFEF292|nr:ChaN family lipoprotein [Faecalibacter sp. LW9]
MKKIYSLFIIMVVPFILNAQDLKSYQFYNKKGKPIKFHQMVKHLADYDVVLFGEHHNNSTNHWLQLQLLKSLFEARKGQLIVGAEMFERDNQEGINQYLKGIINENQLKDHVRLWSNYKTDYHPLLSFSKVHQIPFIATNIPRKYASVVAKKGVEELMNYSSEEKQWMVEMPFPIDYSAPGYPEMIAMMGDHRDKRSENFVAAQAIKDATMAESIVKYYKSNTLFLHFNGDYHSKQYGGIYWYLKQFKPNLKVAVIQIYESNSKDLAIKKEEFKNFIFTDFTLVLPEDTIKTY